MASFSWKRLLLLAGALLSAMPSFATHARGGEIFYTPVAGTANTYHVTVQQYFGTEPHVAQNVGPTTLVCGREGCSANSPGSFVAKLPETKRFRLPSVSCDGVQNTQVVIYEGEVDLPPGRWTLSTRDVNRPFGLLNLTLSGNLSQYIEAFLDNSSGLRNASPQIIADRAPHLLGNQRQLFSFSAFDVDGDSLVYQLTPPLQGGFPIDEPCAQPIASFSPTQFELNGATGQASTIPFALVVGEYVMVVKVQEYRRLNATWTLIGSVVRDLVYSARASSNNTPSFTALQVAGLSQPFDKVIEVLPGQTMVLLLDATDADASQTLTFSSAASTTVPGVSFQPVSATQARLTWQVPADLPSGRYSLPVTVTDNACPNFGTESRSIVFSVGARKVLSSGLGRRPASLFAFPTPFREQVEFRLRQPGVQPVTVWDARGRVVAQLTSTPDGRVVWHPANHLVTGLYLARTADGQQVRLLRE